MTAKSLLPILPSLLLPLFACGCPHFQRPAFNGETGLNGAAVLVVPFGEPGRNLWYGESPRGRLLALAIKNWARENAVDAHFVEGREMDQVLATVGGWTRERITAGDWRSIAGGLGVQYVIEGNLKSLSLRQPTVIGLYDAKATADYRVINVLSGKISYEAPARETRFGGGREMHVADSPGSEGDALIERRLLERLAEEIGKDLYGYYED